MDSSISPVIGLIVPILFYYMYGFGIKYPAKVDMSSNKGSKSKLKLVQDFCINRRDFKENAFSTIKKKKKKKN